MRAVDQFRLGHLDLRANTTVAAFVGLAIAISLLVSACDQSDPAAARDESSPAFGTTESPDFLEEVIRGRERVSAYAFKEVVVSGKRGGRRFAVFGRVTLPDSFVKVGFSGLTDVSRWPYCKDHEIFQLPEFSGLAQSSQASVCFKTAPNLVAYVYGSQYIRREALGSWEARNHLEIDPSLMVSPEQLIDEALAQSERESSDVSFVAANASGSGLDEIVISWGSWRWETTEKTEVVIRVGDRDRLIREISFVTDVHPNECDGEICFDAGLPFDTRTDIQIEFSEYEVNGLGNEAGTNEGVNWPELGIGAFESGHLDQLLARVWRPEILETKHEDLDALEALFWETNGEQWGDKKGWLRYQPISTWYGITTDGDGRVVKLELSNNNLFGEIPSAIDQLTNLEVLVLSGNRLHGTIPKEVGNLAQLRRLDLDGNDFSGTLPSELGRLGNLQVLSFDNQRSSRAQFGSGLEGHIPSELGNLTKLRELNLSENTIAGEIPPELGSLAELQFLELPGNNLGGHIPSELGNLTELRELNLSENNLEGHIPSELGNLTELRELNLFLNKLEGEIPPQLGNLTPKGNPTPIGQLDRAATAGLGHKLVEWVDTR